MACDEPILKVVINQIERSIITILNAGKIERRLVY